MRTTTATVFALIDSLVPVAAGITVDGDPSDWGAIPAFPDPAGDAGGDAARDIVSVRIAPTDAELFVLIETDAAPVALAFAYAYRLRFDFAGFQCFDVDIAPDIVGADGISWFDSGGCSGFTGDAPTWDGTDIAIGAAVEIRVPYAALEAVLPASMQGQLTGTGARPWVRVSTYSTTFTGGFAEVDQGASVGSFRLVTTPYVLDSALPPGGAPFTALPPPLSGLHYVYQGGFNPLTHPDFFGYDLFVADGSLRPESPVGSAVLTDNYSYGDSIRAPVAGTMSLVENAQPDCTPYSGAGCTFPNSAFLEIPGDLGLLFSHTIPGSIPFAASDPVAAGEVVGEIGNSGIFFSWPHLHYEAQDVPSLPTLVREPMGFTDVCVGLNPTADDPWRRCNLASWGIREGYFVQKSPSVPIPGSVGPLLALVILAAAAAIRPGRVARSGWARSRR